MRISVSHLIDAVPPQPGTTRRTGAPWSAVSALPFIRKHTPMSSPREVSSDTGMGRPMSPPSTPDQNSADFASRFRPTRPRMWLIGTICHSAWPIAPSTQLPPATSFMSCCSQNRLRPLPWHSIVAMTVREGIFSRSS